MDAMQASHDAMLGHMALVREAMSFEPLDPKEDQPESQVPLPKPKPKESEAEGKINVAQAADIPQNPAGWEGAIRQYGSGRMDYNNPEQKKWIDNLPEDMEINRGPDSGTGPGESVIIQMKKEALTSQREGGMKIAGDVVPIQRNEPIQLWNVEKPAGFQAESPEHAGAVASGVLRGSLHILKPTPTEGK
jgi:hypothetical protein